MSLRTTVACLLLCSCTSPMLTENEPARQPALTHWHEQAITGTARTDNIVLYNHSDASIRCETVAQLLQKQYDYLMEYVGSGPRWVFVHVGDGYPSGFAIAAAPYPEMFLQAERIFDTQHDYAHEMMHCFTFVFGHLPHWFSESLSDMAYIDAEIELYERREEAHFLSKFDRVDYRSYELLVLRRRMGANYYRGVCRELGKRSQENAASLGRDVSLEDRNNEILDVLSKVAGEDLQPLFVQEFGFHPPTRERQRGY